jgi:UDP-N-acetylmuramoyl-L-alanyl-D-glutamate--2,6-diaminopimelate ligase
MELSSLLEGVHILRIVGTTRMGIEGIAYHSRRVGKRFLFAAIRGMEFDGHRFIEDALQRGAEVVLLEEERAVSSATLIVVPNSRRALARVSANFYGHPSSRVKLVGVTGTKGKTTTTYLLESIFHKAGGRVGVIGTINYRYGGKVMPAPNTTPESLDLQRILAEMVHEGMTHVIMEVSSHGLDLDRVWACEFDVGVFTNFASDHLDYHKTLEHYFRSKQKLFAEYLASGAKARRLAVTNVDDPNGEAMVEGIGIPVLRYGVHSSSDVSAEQARMTLEGVSCRIRTPNGSFDLQSKLVGEYNLYNILAAVSVGIGMDLPLQTLKEGVEDVQGVSGRLEKVENPKGIYVFVDYAHTRDALEQVLLSLRQILPGLSSGEGSSLTSGGSGKMITVFGCGGDRDRTKRPLMGEVAGRYSDLSVLTSDNPRTEDPIAIMDQVEEGFKTLGLRKWNSREVGGWRQEKGYLFIPDRREAIRTAIRLAQPSDTVLIAGKGHEDYQIVGKERFPFDDRVEAKKALEEA